MPRFTLLVRPDGHAMLTTSEKLDEAIAKALFAAIESWKSGEVLILEECDVVQIRELELRLDISAAQA